jgi:ADP-dependent NAD(P)H-hydrate dehydratase / NAD(P)H-hydrate epimerase
MIDVLTPEQLTALDAAAPMSVAALIARAGHGVYRAALDLLGGTYGRRVAILVGPGNNGLDGLTAADLLASRGVKIIEYGVSRTQAPPPHIGGVDLVIDAAFGTGFSGVFVAPLVPPTIPVLAVDLPSGLDAATGEVAEGSRILRATRSVTFAALRPGHLFGEGPQLCGEVTVVDIGLDASSVAQAGLMERWDVEERIPRRGATAHKWNAAVGIIGGSVGMTGAPLLAATAALRSGAGMVQLGVPGDVVSGTEAVGVLLPADGWASPAAAMLSRCASLVLGPGLQATPATSREVRALLGKVSMPAVVDGGALGVLGRVADGTARGFGSGPGVRVVSSGATSIGATSIGATSSRTASTRAELGSHDEARAILKAAFTGSSRGAEPGDASAAPLLPGQRAVLQATARRLGADPRAVAAAGRGDSVDLDAAIRALAGRSSDSTILTPHDGEFAQITGRAPGRDRMAAARHLAAGTGTTVLLKGPTTVIASPDGWVELVAAGDQRLATAGSGDVLAGIIGSLLAQGLTVADAAAVGAYVHGAASVAGGRRVGLVASDLPGLVADFLSGLPG